MKPYSQKEPPAVRVVEGPLFSEVVVYYQHFQQTLRINNVPGGPSFMPWSSSEPAPLTPSLFSGVDGFSVDVTTAVDIRDQNNKELSMRLVTGIQSGDVFYTDLNGFQVRPHGGGRGGAKIPKWLSMTVNVRPFTVS